MQPGTVRSTGLLTLGRYRILARLVLGAEATKTIIEKRSH